MDLYYRYHKTNLEMHLAPSVKCENYEYANDMLHHFKEHSLGICSKKELEQFKRFIELHGHYLIIDES